MKFKTILSFLLLAVLSLPFAAVADTPGEGDKVIRAADFETYREQAKEGDPEAMRCMALCLFNGVGCEPDSVAAMKWYGRAASHGSHEAQYDLACMYRDGHHLKQSDTEAAYWFRKAASNGHVLSQLNIARCFEQGKGVLQDDRIAFEN